MKALINAIDRFCYRHPRFGIPNLMIYIVIGNAIVFLFSMMDTTRSLLSLLSFSPAHILQGQIWRLLTFIFIPGYPNIIYLVIGLYFYYFIGSTLESHWGSGKFTFYYFSGVLLTVVYGFIVWALTGVSEVSVSAFYINLSLFFAFGTLFPDMRIMLFFIIPIKVKWLALLSAVFFVWGIITTPFPHNLLPLIAILNYVIFCGGYLADYIRPYLGSRGKYRSNTINYKKAAKKVQKEMKNKPYTRKCAVCGKTDTDYPDMEFRYCSKCEGYHCFCMDHINSHVHFKGES